MRTIGSLFLAAAFAASGQMLPQAGAEQVYVTAIEVVADVRDAKGALPGDLKASDFVIIEDGVERTVVGLDYLRRERFAGAAGTSPEVRATSVSPATEAERPVWQNVIYFETTLANGTGRLTAAREMLKHVDALVQMGTVDVVFANPIPAALVRNSRDAGAIRAALQKIASSGGVNQLAAHRRDYLRELQNLDSLQSVQGGPSDLAAQVMGGRSTAASAISIGAGNARPFIEHEIQMISDFRQSLMAWLSSYRRHVPRNLILVTDGFDLDPAEFYATSLPHDAQLELRTYITQSTLGTTAAKLGEMLAAGAWTTVSIPSDNNADGWLDDASVSAIGRVHTFKKSHPGSSAKAFLIRPLDPLNAIAETTGGKVVPNSSHIGNVLEGLDDRVRLTYQVDRKPDGKSRKIEVRPRDRALTVRTARFATSATAEDQSRTRAAGLLQNASYPGDLATEGSIEWGSSTGSTKSGTLRATTNVDLVKRLLPPGASAQFRVTLAVQVGRESVVVNRALADIDLDRPVLRFRTPIDVPPGASAIVLVVEETTTGAWGSSRLSIPIASALPKGSR